MPGPVFFVPWVMTFCSWLVEVEKRLCLLLASLCISINALLIFIQIIFHLVPDTLQTSEFGGFSDEANFKHFEIYILFNPW